MEPSNTGSPRTPMSERQQLALIRCMESSSKRPESPPRTPLRSLQNRSGEEEPKTPKTPAEEKLRRKLCKKNAKGETPLHAAAIKGRASLVRRLLALGASPNVKDNAGWSPLHEAANRGNLKVARILIRYGADVNSPGDGKETPLHDAARNGHFQVVEYLVRSGASLLSRNISGSTPLDVASHPENRCRHPGLSQTVDFLLHFSARSQGGELQPLAASDSESSSGEEPDEETLKFLGVDLPRRDMKKALIKQQQQASNLATSSPTPTPAPAPTTPTATATATTRDGSPIQTPTHTVSSIPPSRLTVRLQSQHSSQSSHSSIKTRLTYGMEDSCSKASTAHSSGGPNNIMNTNPSNATTKEDVYEFKSSSKEATPVRSSPEPPHKTDDPSASTAEDKPTGEKRPPEEAFSSEEEHKRKKPKKEEVISKGRGSRGNSMEKLAQSNTGKTRSSALSDNAPPNSNSGSPQKTESESEDDDNSKKSTDSQGLKVPPLKIVLSGNNGGSGSTPPSSSSAEGGTSRANESSNNSNQGGGVSNPANEHTPASTTNTTTFTSTACSSSSSTSSSLSSSCNNTNTNKKTGGATTGRYLVNKDDNTAASASNSSSSSGSSFANHHEEGTGGGLGGGGKSAEDTTSEGENSSSALTMTTTPASGGGGSNEKGGRMTRRASSSSDQAATDSSDNKNPSSDYSFKKRKLRSQVEDSSSVSTRGGGNGGANGSSNGGGSINNLSSNNCNNSNGSNANGGNMGGNGGNLVSEPMNDIEKYLNIRKQIEQRRKNLFPVQPKPPQGFKDYLMNKKSYLLQENANERLRQIPLIQPPPSLEGVMVELFKEQEEARRKLRMKHVVEKEKLVLSVEQEILRVHGRAARALANQSLPYSLCTILRDEEIYTPIDPQQEEKNRDIRSRYNGRLFLSWLQDVDDKWERIKEQMVLRHHNEAESLNAVQKMDWEWKLKEISDNPSSFNDSIKPQIDDLLIPMVHVSDEFGLTDCRN